MDAIVGAFVYRIIVFLAGVLLCATTLADGAYLVRVGPKPLRFAEATLRRNAVDVLPPLSMNDASTTNAAMAEVTEPAPSDAAPAAEEMTSVDPGDTSNDTQAARAPAPTMGVTPDTLLQFFTPARGKGTTVGLPVDFTPPTATMPRSSTATYTSK